MAAKIAHFDCYSGISGDMVLGALVDAGLAADDLRAAVRALDLPGLDIAFEPVVRCGIGATKAHVSTGAGAITPEQEHHLEAPHDHPHDHSHEHPHSHSHEHSQGHTPDPAPPHGHTRLEDILAVIDRAQLPAVVRERATAIYRRLAEAEAAVHGLPMDQVHLHEVGSHDAIADIVGAVAGLHLLGVDEVHASALHCGSGTVNCAHGRYPLPAPGVLALCQGIPLVQTDTPFELVTPTGAAIITSLASSFGPPPPHRQLGQGYGAGGRDLESAPNVLRLRLGERLDREQVDRAVVIEANIDDMNPEIFGYLFERLLAEGALDVYVAPVHMKKGRPGHLLSVLATEDGAEHLADLVLAETTTLGVRFHAVERRKLKREAASVETEFGPVRVKVCHWPGGRRVTPEYEDCARLARAGGVPIQSVYRAAAAAREE